MTDHQFSVRAVIDGSSKAVHERAEYDAHGRPRLWLGADIFPVGVPDGQINAFDYGSQIITWFNAQDPRADLNGDGLVNFHDLTVYGGMFNSQQYGGRLSDANPLGPGLAHNLEVMSAAIDVGAEAAAAVAKPIAIVGASMIPGVGEGMDAVDVAAPGSSTTERVVGGLSLAANYLTGGFAPNSGGARRAGTAALEGADAVGDAYGRFKALAKSSASAPNTPTDRAVRRAAMREQGIPTSRPAIAQNNQGGARQLVFEGHDGTPQVVSRHAADAKHPNDHWHATPGKVENPGDQLPRRSYSNQFKYDGKKGTAKEIKPEED